MDQSLVHPYLFLGKFVWTNGPDSSSEVSPYTGIGPWVALPSVRGQKSRTRKKKNKFLGTEVPRNFSGPMFP